MDGAISLLERTAGAAPPIGLDALSAHWRVAFDAAEDTLAAANRSNGSIQLPPSELHERAARLAQERKATADILNALAREEHVLLTHRLSAPRATRRMLGLPEGVLACVFALDGVLTASAALHAAAWAETFDELLSRRVERTGERFAPFMPFEAGTDYFLHIHGRPRLDGVRGFLASRGIRLPEGTPDDPPGAETVHGLANRKNEALRRRLEREGVTAFAGSRRYLEDLREARLLSAVVSASANTGAILERAGLGGLVGPLVDGNAIRAEGLRVKPAPDTLLAACTRLRVRPQEAAVFETTAAGIAAGREAGFGLVVGVDRAGRAEALYAHGADVVVPDLSSLLDAALSA
jgi:beta-phosphoglucomutase-like phosphatase (HAD superfamily)